MTSKYPSFEQRKCEDNYIPDSDRFMKSISVIGPQCFEWIAAAMTCVVCFDFNTMGHNNNFRNLNIVDCILHWFNFKRNLTFDPDKTWSLQMRPFRIPVWTRSKRYFWNLYTSWFSLNRVGHHSWASWRDFRRYPLLALHDSTCTSYLQSFVTLFT